MSASAGPHCWAPGQLFPQCLEWLDWQRGGGGIWPVLLWLPLQAASYSDILLSNCHWQAIRPCGSVRALCRWPNCPSTNISSELLDHVKKHYSCSYSGPSRLRLLDKSFRAQITESREKRRINTSMRRRLTFTVRPNWFNKGRVTWLSFCSERTFSFAKEVKGHRSFICQYQGIFLTPPCNKLSQKGMSKSISPIIRLPANALVRSHARSVSGFLLGQEIKIIFNELGNWSIYKNVK